MSHPPSLVRFSVRRAWHIKRDEVDEEKKENDTKPAEGKFPRKIVLSSGRMGKKLGAKANESCPFYLVLLCASDETNLTNTNGC